MHIDETSKKIYYWRSEILDIIKVLRKKYEIDSPMRMYCDSRDFNHPSSIGGKSLKYYMILSEKKKFKKFLKHLAKVLDVFDLEVIWGKDIISELDERQAYYSFQIYKRSING